MRRPIGFVRKATSTIHLLKVTHGWGTKEEKATAAKEGVRYRDRSLDAKKSDWDELLTTIEHDGQNIYQWVG